MPAKPKSGQAPSAPDLSGAAVLKQLERIVSSPDLRVSERGRGFLHYVVEETLAGRADRIKAYAIAIEVFGRDETFDAQNDPVVRIEAGRLRRALEYYYLAAGTDDPILIDIPKGGYVPTFALRRKEKGAEPQVPGAPPSKVSYTHGGLSSYAIATLGLVIVVLLAFLFWRDTDPGPVAGDTLEASLPREPVLVVAPFVGLGKEDTAKLYAARLTEEITAQMARFRELTVLGRETTATLAPIADQQRLQGELGVDFLVEGSVRTSSNRIRVTARLIDTSNEAIIWVQSYDDDIEAQDLLEIETDIASQMAMAIAQPYGIIFRPESTRPTNNPPAEMSAYRCTLEFYAYRRSPSEAKHRDVRDCLERAIARYPGYATAWAMLSHLHTDEARLEFNPRQGQGAAIDRALEAAQRAVALEPRNVRALQAQMLALFYAKRDEEALEIGERALALNPNDTELLGEFGTRVAQSGDWQRGLDLIGQARARNPGYAGHYSGLMAACAYMMGDVEQALVHLRQADPSKWLYYYGFAAMIYTDLGMVSEAAEARERFQGLRPQFFENLEAELLKRNFKPADRERLREAGMRAGFIQPDPVN
ncbi:MAG: adenylate cyclase [Pseudomonadota bacterium]